MPNWGKGLPAIAALAAALAVSGCSSGGGDGNPAAQIVTNATPTPPAIKLGLGATPVATKAPTPTPAPTQAPTVAATPAPATQALSVTITSLPASVKHGANATVAATTTKGAVCTATVQYASGTISTAAGLKPARTADSAGEVSWTWKVGTNTNPGVSTATVYCQLSGRSGSAVKTFKVT